MTRSPSAPWPDPPTCEPNWPRSLHLGREASVASVGLAIPSPEHLPGRAGQGRAGACSLRQGTTRAWLVQTMSIRRQPHATQRQRSCTNGVSPR
jgi:hypothetical protein